MNLIFLHDLNGDLIAVNPEYIVRVEVAVIEGAHVTAIYFQGTRICVTDKFDDVISTLHAWRKKV